MSLRLHKLQCPGDSKTRGLHILHENTFYNEKCTREKIMSESDYVDPEIFSLHQSTDFDQRSTAIYNLGYALCSQSASANDVTGNARYAVCHTVAASKLIKLLDFS